MRAPCSDSRFARLGNAWPASRTHAVVIRLSPEVTLSDLQCGMSAQRGSLFGEEAKLVSDRIPSPSASQPARERRQRECTRPLAVDAGQELRVTVLHYGDDERDLVLAGDRSRFDQHALQHAARSLLDPTLPPATRAPEAALAPEDAQLERLRLLQLSPLPSLNNDGEAAGSTRMGYLEVALDAGLAPEHWVAALALVLQRCHGASRPAVAISLPRQAMAANVPQTLQGERYRLVDLSMPVDASTHATVKSLQACLQQAPWITEALLSALGSSSGDPAGIGIGLLFAGPAPAPGGGMVHCQYVCGDAHLFPLTICVADQSQPGVVCRYDGNLYSSSTLEWLLRSLVHVAVQISGVDQHVDALQLLPDADLEQIAALGRVRLLPSAPPQRIEEVFAHRALLQPDATALTEGDRSLSYAELDTQSRHMAAHLLARGVTEGSTVGLCLPRSLDVVVAMLGVLRCGGTYVPMDPDYPAERLRYTTQDASVALVVTLGDPNVDFGVPTLDIAALSEGAATPSNAAARTAQSGSQAAYIIYTSGSTGRPKGVVVPHRNVLDLVRATETEFSLSPADTWTLFHSSAFDFSVWEIWGCLLTGGHLVIVPHGVSRDPTQFIALLNQHSVSVLNQTPSAFYQLIEADQHDRVAESLRLVIFGGEALDMRLLLPWFDHHPPAQCRLINMFGITETTVHVTMHEISRGDALCGSRTVGRALAGWHLYVMNSRQQLLPPGCIGEIYVGGVGVASCYLNRPDLTASRFLPDPYAAGPMYRSGDCGRLAADGTLEHLGRLDSQVKVRGFRIELDEIRRVMLEQSGVKAAAVLLNQSDPRDAATARIDAYVVAEEADITALRKSVARLLPQHMMPSSIVRVERMPMTVNGKLDAGKLRSMELIAAPALDPATQGDQGDQADSDQGMRMLGIWREIMGKQIRLDDNFFDLGGNSLIGIRIASAMRKQGLPPLPLAELYTHQTVRKLVAALGLD